MTQKYYVQVAPWPDELEDLVSKCELDPDWLVKLYANYPRDYPNGNHAKDPIGYGCTLVITTRTYNSYHHDRGRTYEVNHIFAVPPATYDRASWRRWLFDRYQDVLVHEACENFVIDGERPYAPIHAPGVNPYVVHELTTDELRRTSYLGVTKNSD